MSLTEEQKLQLSEALEQSGLRTTRQREHVFQTLMETRTHPTADEVFARARADVGSISLATVYNCLESLVQSGLVRQVNFEREPTRYCPNLAEHAHFYDNRSGRVFDIDLPEELIGQLTALLPEGFQASDIEINFRGRASETATASNQAIHH